MMAIKLPNLMQKKDILLLAMSEMRGIMCLFGNWQLNSLTSMDDHGSPILTSFISD